MNTSSLMTVFIMTPKFSRIGASLKDLGKPKIPQELEDADRNTEIINLLKIRYK